MTADTLFPRLTSEEATRKSSAPLSDTVLETARGLIGRVRRDGEAALSALTLEFQDREPGAPLYVDRAALSECLIRLDAVDRTRLEHVAGRIGRFAAAQRDALTDMDLSIEGGRAGHEVSAVDAAGCYAPGGRYPLPSTVLMTALTARAAGVSSVWVASPRPTPLTMAAAALAGADGLLVAGGAPAIAALTIGVGPLPACDVVVGPGNRYVTAAKQILFGQVRIDMLAGPSELTVLADDSADPAIVAADLLAQAEHDPHALPILVTTSRALADAVDQELSKQLATLPTADVATAALRHGGATIVRNLADGIELCNELASEHLEVMVEDIPAARSGLRHYGAIFLGSDSAEVFGDYGVGPNHVLPTGGTARGVGGLSVFTFLRVRTWLELDAAVATTDLVDDVTWMARAEGLEAHARAAEARGRPASPRASSEPWLTYPRDLQ